MNNWCIRGCKELKELLNPETNVVGSDSSMYYHNTSNPENYLKSKNWKYTREPKGEVISVEEFKTKILKMKREIIGYKLVKPEYRDAAFKLASEACLEREIENLKVSTHNLTIPKLKEAGVLDLWFEPVYEDEYKIGDYVYINNTDSQIFGIIRKTEKVHKGAKQGDVVKIEGITYEDGLANKEDPRYYGSNWNLRAESFRKATKEEIEKHETKTISVGGKFDVTIKNNEIWHKSDNITSFVKALCDSFKGTHNAANYTYDIKDVTFSRTGCQNVETKLTDWLNILNEII